MVSVNHLIPHVSPLTLTSWTQGGRGGRGEGGGEGEGRGEGREGWRHIQTYSTCFNER